MQTLRGRTCLFAGATGGDGVDAVKALCAGGMNVVMMTHNAEHAERVLAEVRALNLPGGCAYSAGGGKRAAEESEDVYREISAKYGSIDVIIHNVGTDGRIDDLETLDPEELGRSVSFFTTGALKTLQTALPYLKKSAAPRVIFMTTTEGVRGGTYESFANAVGKGAMASMTLLSAARLAKYGITVNCVAKGPIPRVEGVSPGDPDPADRLSAVPLGRLGTPADLAAAICFFASEESAWITGQVLELSGGMNLGR